MQTTKPIPRPLSSLCLLGLASLIALVLVLLQPSPRVEAQKTSQAETAVETTVVLTSPRGSLRTFQDMAKDEAAHGPVSGGGVVPFRPNMSDAEYKAAKAAAAAQGLRPGSKPAVAPQRAPLGPPTVVLQNIEGINRNESNGGWFPPDTHGAIGTSQFVEVTNSTIRVYDRFNPTTAFQATASLNGFFGYFAQPCFDPRVVYDTVWNRWVVLADAFPESGSVQRVLLAISLTSNATGPYIVYSFNLNFFGGEFVDFPQLGLDQDAIIITWTNFPSGACPPSCFGARVFAVAKARVYAGLGFGVPVFINLIPTLAPPIVIGQNANTYLVAASPSGSGSTIAKYTLRNSSKPSGVNATSLSGPTFITVDSYSLPPSAPQPGFSSCGSDPAHCLETNDSRFVNASTQIGNSLFQVHTVNLGGFAAPKFYEFDVAGDTLIQSGFFFATGSSFDFNASIAANASKDVFVTWSTTDPPNGTNAQVRFSGRLHTDGLGAISGGLALFTSPVALTGNFDSNFGLQRWGDYSAVTIDPANGLRAWIVNEKINSSSVWGSRIGQIGY